MSRIVIARLDGPDAGLDERGDDVEVDRSWVYLADAGRRRIEPEMVGDRPTRVVSTASGEPRSSSMSCCVPTGPLMPRSG